MDDSVSQDRPPGGTVEPANRAPIAKARFQTPEELAAERYELRDPFDEVTYRVKAFDAMVAKADQLGASRFFAVDPDGKRTPVVKVDGAWQRADASGPEREATQRHEQHAAAKVVPLALAGPRPPALVPSIDAEAERATRIEQLEAALNERYVIKRASVKLGDVTIGQTEYRYRGDMARVAFTESTFRLATDNNNPLVARSMVDVAEARNWQGLRVSGHEDFRRMVWLEASLRGVRTLGYEPHPGDEQLLQKEREARRSNRIEPMPAQAAPGGATDKPSGRGGGGRKAVLEALEAVLVAKRVPAKQREAVMTAAAEQLAQRLRAGEKHKVKVFDRAAPAHGVAPTAPTPDTQRTRERAPVR